MARLAAILVLAIFGASAVAAHPFDERCELLAEIIVQKSASGAEELVLQFQFLYETPYASYNEAYLSLDADRDEHVSRAEVTQRLDTLAADLLASVYLAVRGDEAKLEPDKDKFVFANLDDPDASVDQAGGMPLSRLRIGYFFFFRVKLAYGLNKGMHPVEFYLANRRVAISNPDDQLRAWDDRGPRRKAILSVQHDETPDRYQRLKFIWDLGSPTEVAPQVTPEPKVMPGPEVTQEPEVKPEPKGGDGKQQLIETDQQRRGEESNDSKIVRELELLRDGGAGLWVWIVVLSSMFIWGATHALMPGHGKALVAGYLVSTRGTKTDALFLGLVVTAAHTSGVYLLLGAAWAVRSMWPGMLDNPEKQLAEWISLAVGATILLMGIGLVMKRTGGQDHAHDIFGRHVHPSTGSGHSHDHDSDILHEAGHHHDHPDDHHHDHHHGPGHAHDHHHGHTHRDPSRMTRGEILRLGILGGIIPCPSAFIIGLFAFQWRMEVTGLIAVLVFSLGLAAVLATIGLVLVQGKSYLRARAEGKPDSPLSRFLEAQLPVLGALVITIVGVMLVAFSLIRLGIIDPAKFSI